MAVNSRSAHETLFQARRWYWFELEACAMNPAVAWSNSETFMEESFQTPLQSVGVSWRCFECVGEFYKGSKWANRYHLSERLETIKMKRGVCLSILLCCVIQAGEVCSSLLCSKLKVLIEQLFPPIGAMTTIFQTDQGIGAESAQTATVDDKVQWTSTSCQQRSCWELHVFKSLTLTNDQFQWTMRTMDMVYQFHSTLPMEFSLA